MQYTSSLVLEHAKGSYRALVAASHTRPAFLACSGFYSDLLFFLWQVCFLLVLNYFDVTWLFSVFSVKITKI